MKRKFKLFATVASLCLCFALMAFGVYAAASVSYTIKSSVSFEVADVFADISYTYNTKIGGNVAEGTKTTVKTYKNMSNPIAQGGKLLNNEGEALEANEVSLAEAKFTAVGDYAEYIIEVQNVGENAIKASIVLAGVEDTINGLTVTKTAESATSNSLNKDGTVTYTLKLELVSLNYTVSVPNIQFVVTAEK